MKNTTSCSEGLVYTENYTFKVCDKESKKSFNLNVPNSDTDYYSGKTITYSVTNGNAIFQNFKVKKRRENNFKVYYEANYEKTI